MVLLIITILNVAFSKKLESIFTIMHKQNNDHSFIYLINDLRARIVNLENKLQLLEGGRSKEKMGLVKNFYKKNLGKLRRLINLLIIYRGLKVKENYLNLILLNSLRFTFSARFFSLLKYLSMEIKFSKISLIINDNTSKEKRRIDPPLFLKSYLSLINQKNITLLFDHFGGGGANLFSREALQDLLSDNHLIIRLGTIDGCWVGLIRHKNFDQELFMLFEEHDGVLKFASSLGSVNVLLNSLYGVNNFDEFSRDFAFFVRQSNPLGITFLLHDYLSICPSLHLLGSNHRYCGVPRNSIECNSCFSKLDLNLWLHNYAGAKKISAKTIESWRSNFVEIFKTVTKITYFSNSSKLIFQGVFPEFAHLLEKQDSKLTQHNLLRPVRRFKNLHIGFIGPISQIKGRDKILGLNKYLKERDLLVPQTVLGDWSTGAPPDIRVHGKYEIERLPDLIEEIEVSVIFFSSIVPETFSFVLTELFAMNIPVVCFDLGAQAERVKNYPLGIVIPLDAPQEEIYNALITANKL